MRPLICDLPLSSVNEEWGSWSLLQGRIQGPSELSHANKAKQIVALFQGKEKSTQPK